ncbi:MAG: ABC transporter permease [Bacteroidota bacterium]
MFNNYFKTAWRILWRNKLQTGINTVGLAIGIAGCLSVFLLVEFELGHNKDIVDADRIYRVYSNFYGQFSGANPGVPTGIKNLAETSVEGTEVQCMMHTYLAQVTLPGEFNEAALKKMDEQKDIVVTGPEYFDLIQNYEWLAGAPRQSLGAPYQVVLTESKARKYFGLKDATEALGRTVVYQDSLRMTVAGILKNPDFRSDFHFNDFISAQTIPSSFLKDEIPDNAWGSTRSADQLFIKTSEGVTQAAMTGFLSPLNDRANEGEESEEEGQEFLLQPLSDLHYNQELGLFDNSRPPAHKPTLMGLILVAILLLLLAAINFINLSTVQATLRSKETGVKKAIGASQAQLRWQFLIETGLLTLLTVPLAMALSELALRFFAEFLPSGFAMSFWSLKVMLFLIGAVVLVTFLAGLYPSFVISSFNPAFAISKASGGGIGKNSSRLRKSLIVFQFVLAQVFIIGAVMIGRQMNYLLQKDLGFDQESVVYFYNWRGGATKKELFKDRLQQLPHVSAVGVQNKPPMAQGYQTSFIEFPRDSELVEMQAHFRYVDTSFLNLYGIELLAGRNLLPSDTVAEFLINETLAADLGHQDPADAVGQTVEYGDNQVPIVGVVKDFHVRSFHHAIPPTVITANNRSAWSVAVKISSAEHYPATMESVRQIWKEVYADDEMRHFVLNDAIEKMYASEARTAKLINTATGLAILVSCLGLFGLAFFSVTQRAKEISIRKVLGATVAQVVGLISRDIVKLVIIALVIASPLAYFFMDHWLQDFAYSIPIPWWVFILAGLVAVTVAFLTVGLQSLKAALANPVESLRSE